MAEDAENDDGRFQLNLLEALGNSDVAARFRSIIAPPIEPLSDAVQRNMPEVASLGAQLADCDATIERLQSHVSDLEIKIDDLEQHGRRGSIRVLGLPEETAGTLNEKLWSLFNENLEFDPPLVVEDIEVTHRLDRGPKKAQDQQQSSQQSPADGTDADTIPSDDINFNQRSSPMPTIVKFVSSRTKTRVMDARKLPKDNLYQYPDGTTAKVFLVDDLTKHRANLAYQARNWKRAGAIFDNWTFEGRVLVKHKHRRIKLISASDDLRKFQ